MSSGGANRALPLWAVLLALLVVIVGQSDRTASQRS